MNQHWGFILNPIAGDGYSGKQREAVRSMIKKYQPSGELQLTEAPGHATDLAADYIRRGFTHIVVVGGDGTVHEAAQVMVGNPDVALGVISAGTGNDFIQIAGFPDRFGANEWKTLFRGNRVSLDVGTCNGRYFFNGMGLGFDAEMTAAVTAYRERTGHVSKGKYTYFIVKTLLGYREKTMYTGIDGERIKERCFLTTCSIGRRFAGGYYMTPLAIANDGLLDVMRIQPLSLPERLNILLKVPKGSHLGHKKVGYQRTEGLTIELEKETAAHLDGELLFSKKFEIGILPGALNLIYNPEGNHYLSL